MTSACGGGASGADTAATTPTSVSDTAASNASGGPATSVSAERLVESADGRATLLLPAGSLPEGVSAGDVSLAVAVDETGEPGMPVIGVQLLPDGLFLTEPATLTVALPEALRGALMAIHVSGDSAEPLAGDILQDDGSLSFQTSVEHFSSVWFYRGRDIFGISIELAPERVSVGETQRASNTVVANGAPISVCL